MNTTGLVEMKRKQFIETIKKGGKQFIENLRIPLLLFAEILTQIKLVDFESQKKYFDLHLKLTFTLPFIINKIPFNYDFIYKDIQSFNIPLIANSFKLFVNKYFEVIELNRSLDPTYLSEFTLLLLSSVFDFSGEMKDVMASMFFISVLDDALNGETITSKQLITIINAKTEAFNNGQNQLLPANEPIGSEQKEINGQEKQINLSTKTLELPLEEIKQENSQSIKKPIIKKDEKEIKDVKEAKEVKKKTVKKAVKKKTSKKAKVAEDINEEQIDLMKESKETLKSIGQNSNQPVEVQKNNENKMIEVQSIDLEQPEALQEIENQTNLLLQEINAFLISPKEDKMKEIVKEEVKEEKQEEIKEKPKEERKKPKEINKEEKKIEKKKVVINEEKRNEILKTSNSYKFVKESNGFICFELKQNSTQKLEMGSDKIYYFVKDLNNPDKPVERTFDNLIKCEEKSEEIKKIRMNVWSYKEIITDDYIYNVEKSILQKRGVNITTKTISISKYSKIKYYPFVLGLRCEYLKDRRIECPNEPIIFPIKIKTSKTKYYCLFYDIYFQGNVEDILIVEVTIN